ncbi:ras-related protein Rab-19 isoform X1 [Paramisgurnus dabryanus]|uniref:ras-related protein Rab-19 isoform X1 n=2 Tax=Paramisgurnus dabryanus TaxID=90735 RepID=UPI0031F473E0
MWVRAHAFITVCLHTQYCRFHFRKLCWSINTITVFDNKLQFPEMHWCRWAGNWTSHLQTQSTGEDAEDCCDYLFKIVLIGDSNVGKTCVIHSFSSGVFSDSQHNTIGVDFTVRTIDIDGKKVKMQVWDTAGQERFRTITQSYYRSAHGAMIAYDLTRRPTFESLPHWIQGVEQYGAANVVFVLIGNKCDLESQRQVLFEDACTLAEKKGALAALETSAKHYHNIEEAFELMARELIIRHGGIVHQDNQSDSPRVFLHSDSHPVEEGGLPEKKSCDC